MEAKSKQLVWLSALLPAGRSSRDHRHRELTAALALALPAAPRGERSTSLGCSGLSAPVQGTCTEGWQWQLVAPAARGTGAATHPWQSISLLAWSFLLQGLPISEQRKSRGWFFICTRVKAFGYFSLH